ncbi:MAG: RidA family protein [Tepidimonas taiwanensis]|nr:RidA family protein [Tepidimonas taiwanensis]
MSIEQTLADKGITLPEAPTPAANYVPFVQTGSLVFISGQISADENGLIVGKLGDNTSVEDGAAAARRCGLALIAQLKSAVGDLDRVTRVVKLTGFVNSTPDVTDQPKVINGCSDLMVEVFGNAGRHARAAVSAPSLPFGVAVEIEAIFEIR